MSDDKLRPTNPLEHKKMQWIHRIHFLPSEEIMCLDKTMNGGICLTNYRVVLYCRHQSTMISIPTLLIRLCETSSLVHMDIVTKIGTTFTCQFRSFRACEEWVKQLSTVIGAASDFSQMFAPLFWEELKKSVKTHPILSSTKQTFNLNDNDTNLEAAMILQEFNRLEFNNSWKVTDVNSTFQICKNYPKYHIMPRDVSDQDIPNMATFRSHHRFPSVVWRSRRTGAVLLRCAQPRVGIMYSRNEFDERFVAAVLENCKRDPLSKRSQGDSHKLLIIDARNYSAAQFNRLRGGGFEYMEYYDQSQIRFMDLPNLHSVRMSFERMVLLYKKPDSSWFTTLEKSMWLSYISQLLKSAVEIAAALDVHGCPVMVHCTDGWDRTPQLTSLAELLLDPYYRTIQGFRILVEREWLQFGHKFGDRCGHSLSPCSSEEQSPIFLQWLDCVRQIQRQFPSYFEFNELFLVKMAIHTYSGLFGTFLCNSELERQENNCTSKTCSIWAFLNPNYNWSIVNYLYEERKEVINPACHVSNLELWDTLYVKALLSSNVSAPLGQPPVFITPLRRGSNTSAPLQISTSEPTNVNIATNSNDLPVTSIVVPTTTLSETSEVHASVTTLTDVRQRSQSLSYINHKFGDLALNASETVKSETKAGGRLTIVRHDTSLSAPDLLPITPSDVNLTTNPEDAKSSDKDGLKLCISGQSPVLGTPNKSQPKHTRSGSDPPFCSGSKQTYSGFRLSSLGDTDILVVNTALDDSHDVEEVEGLVAPDDDVLPIAESATPALCSETVEGGLVDPLTTQNADTSTSSFSPMSQSTFSLSGGAIDGMKTWVDGYFGGPVFSANFRKLADESLSASENDEPICSPVDSFPADQTADTTTDIGSGGNDSNSDNRINNHPRSHTESEIRQFFHTDEQTLPRSTTLLSSNVSDLPQFSGLPYDVPDFRSSPVAPEHGIFVDWDGLPLRIDLVTLKLHERQRLEYYVRIDHQNQINRLEANVQSLVREVSRLRTLIENSNTSQHLREIIDASASFNGGLSSPLIPLEATAVLPSGFVNESENPLSIVEALSDAMGHQQDVEDSGDYGDGHTKNGVTPAKPPYLMTNSATDDILLNWSDELAVHNTAPFTRDSPPRRGRYGPSTSSDYSSFDVVESSTIFAYSSVPGGPVCGKCDLPLDGFESPLPSSYCVRSFCGSCAETTKEFNCRPICGACDRKCLVEATEDHHPSSALRDNEAIHGDEYHQGYSLNFPQVPPFSNNSRVTVTNTSRSPTCVDVGLCGRLERRFPSVSSLTCSRAHSQNGTAKA